jgi:hypothetical protein
MPGRAGGAQVLLPPPRVVERAKQTAQVRPLAARDHRDLGPGTATLIICGEVESIVSLLETLDAWFKRRVPDLEAAGLKVSITHGPEDRNPPSLWLDFESVERSARLMIWSNGDADLMIGDLVRAEVLLEEHREITSEIGLDDAERTIRAWLT